MQINGNKIRKEEKDLQCIFNYNGKEKNILFNYHALEFYLNVTFKEVINFYLLSSYGTCL